METNTTFVADKNLSYKKPKHLTAISVFDSILFVRLQM